MSEWPKVGVGIIVVRMIDGRPHIMMHQRRKKLYKDHWGTGGGNLEFGESMIQGALRELREEAGKGIKVVNTRFLGVYNSVGDGSHYADISFIADWNSGEPNNTEPEKVGDWHWLPLDDLPEPLFPPVRTYLKAYKTGLVFFDSEFK